MQRIESVTGKYEQHRKIRLCHVVRHAKIAGTEKHVYLLASGIDKRRFEVHVCTFEHGALVQKLLDSDVIVKVIPRSHSVFHFIKLVRFFLKGDYDLVHCHSGGYACVAAKMAQISRILYTKHGIGFTPEELRIRSFSRKLRDRVIDVCVAKYIALTRYDRLVMMHVLGIAGNKIEVIYNGIDPKFSTTECPRRTKSQKLIGTVGRLTRQKGIEFLIRAMPMIVSEYGNVKLLIAGSGEEESWLKNLAQQLGLEKRIEFLGYVDDPAGMMRNLDVFVLPSVWEGFPYVLLEAMFLRRPIVATDIFGVNEIIKDQSSGILVKPRDPDRIAQAVIALLSNARMSRKIGEAAYREVLDDFTLDVSVSKTISLYSQLLSGVRKSK